MLVDLLQPGHAGAQGGVDEHLVAQGDEELVQVICQPLVWIGFSLVAEEYFARMAQIRSKAFVLAGVLPMDLDQEVSKEQVGIAIANHLIHHVIKAMVGTKAIDDGTQIRMVAAETGQSLGSESGEEQSANLGVVVGLGLLDHPVLLQAGARRLA